MRKAMQAQEPSARALRAIEQEWPQIAAELAELDREIAALSAHRPQVSELDRRRVRREQTRRLRAAVEGARSGDLGGVA